MELDNLREGGSADSARATRLLVGYAAAAAFLGLVFYAAVVSARNVVKEQVDEEIPVTFADLEDLEEEKAPEEPEPEPEIEAEPPPPVPNPQPQLPGPRQPPAPDPGEKLEANPEDMPEDDPDKADPSKLKDQRAIDKFGDGSQGPTTGGPGGGGGPGPGGGAPPPPPPPPPPKKPGLTRITEDVEPPQMLSCPSPSPPADVVGEGGVVIVKYIVEANGAVGRVKAVRGPAALRPYAEAAVKGCRFKPARDKKSGVTLRVPRVARIPFRAKTNL